MELGIKTRQVLKGLFTDNELKWIEKDFGVLFSEEDFSSIKMKEAMLLSFCFGILTIKDPESSYNRRNINVSKRNDSERERSEDNSSGPDYQEGKVWMVGDRTWTH